MTIPGSVPASPLALALLGPPGAGKGTQGRLLAERRGFVTLSTGELFRAEQAQGTAVGVAAARYMAGGLLVPDPVVLRALYQRMDAVGDAAHGVVFDGFPRTMRQALALDQLLAPDRLTTVIELALPSEVALGRLRARDRLDDGESAIQRRFAVHEATTAPVFDWYRRSGRLSTIDADVPIDDLHAAILEVVDALDTSASRVSAL